MSGHSKWSTIHRQKEASDQKRGQVFTKIANAILVAVRESGIVDPEKNFKLRLAMEKARQVNMPKENIQRAIDRAAGKGETSEIEEIVYEGYGPAGVGILVETATDNRQRTIQEVKNIFERHGGSITSPGAVAFNFKKVGLITLPAKDSLEESMLKIIDLGAEEVEEATDGMLEVYTNPELLMSIRQKLSESGFQPSPGEIVMRPVNLVPVTDPKTVQQVIGLLEKLEALPDVQKVFANFDIPEEILTQL